MEREGYMPEGTDTPEGERTLPPAPRDRTAEVPAGMDPRMVDLLRRMRGADEEEEETGSVSRITPEGVDEEQIVIQTSYGTRRVWWPKDSDLKKAKMREILAMMESESQNPVLQTEWELINAAIASMSRRPEYQDIAQQMYKEVQARLSFRNAFFAFEPATRVDAIDGAVKQLRAEHLNVLLRLPGFAYILSDYDQSSDDFIKLEGPAKDFFRRQAQIQLVKLIRNTPEDNKLASLKKVFKEAELERLGALNITKLDQFKDSDKTSLDKIAWVQNLAERFWRMSGRRAARDHLKPGESSFLGEDASGGDWTLRRIFRLQDSLVTQTDAMRPFTRLLDGVSLGQVDYLSLINTALAPKDANGNATNISSNGSINFAAINWDEVDFRRFGDIPMSDWSFRRVSMPDGARDAMHGKDDTFLRNPNENTLYALIGAFDYLGKGRWEVKKQLIINFARFAMEERSSVTGKRKYSDEAVMTLISNLTGLLDENKAPFIHPKDREGVIKEVKEMIGQPRAFLSRPDVKLTYVFLGSFLWGIIAYIWNLIKGDIKSGK